MPYNMNVADVSISASGDNTVITGVTGRRIRVYAFSLQNTDATTTVGVVFKDGSTAYNATAFQMSAGQGWDLGTIDGAQNFVFDPAAQGNNLVINLSGAQAVTGRIWYQVI